MMYRINTGLHYRAPVISKVCCVFGLNDDYRHAVNDER